MIKVGILGGGQLGRMLIQQGLNYNLDFYVLDPDPNCPCAGISNFTVGKFSDEETVYQFGKDLDVITIEIEHVSVSGLRKLEQEGKKVFPQPDVIELIQDKGAQKEFYARHFFPTSDFVLVTNKEGLRKESSRLPFMQKLRKGGYDGRGVKAMRSEHDFVNGFDEPSVLEHFVSIDSELSVLVARNRQGELRTFPLVELVFNPEANLVEMLFSPARISMDKAKEASEIAAEIAKKLNIVGLLAVELFLTTDQQILVNEIAPRPHNSGHHTIEGNASSQYDQHIRAIMGWPLGATHPLGYSAMINLLGEKGFSGPAVIEGYQEVLATPGANFHWYGKEETRPFRKMGHITVVADDAETARNAAERLMKTVRIKS